MATSIATLSKMSLSNLQIKAQKMGLIFSPEANRQQLIELIAGPQEEQETVS